ncbi:MAG: peptidase domain-containing ABC transporter [Candidatus Kapaibacteriales bacterium]
MISKHYGKNYTLQFFRERCFISREGVSLLGTSEGAESVGFRTAGYRLTYEDLIEKSSFPCIAHWEGNHFVVIYKITKKFIWIADPGRGKIKYTKKDFLDAWASGMDDGEKNGIVLLLEPTPEFFSYQDEKTDKQSFKHVWNYVKPYKKYLIQLFIGLLIGSLIQLIMPLLTQAVVDIGISSNDIDFIYLVLAAQLALLVGRMTINLISDRIELHIGTRINISMVSDFLIKMMKLPLMFYDRIMIGDIFQRVEDHKRIQDFLTESALGLVYSAMNIIIFGIVIAIFDVNIFIVFLLFTFAYIIWILFFLKKLKILDQQVFEQKSKSHTKLNQIISGIQDIKLNNNELPQRWDWEKIQTKLFTVSLANLNHNQLQSTGSTLINEMKNIIITIMSATAVINGQITLGMMLSLQFIIGQLNAPLQQVIELIQKYQYAKVSLERINEIHVVENEEDENEEKVVDFPENNHTIKINDLSFSYEGKNRNMIIDQMNLEIEEAKITAIVGASGSGKSTLMKILLGFYKPTKGEIKIDNVDLYDYSTHLWKSKIGVVMQEGYVFTDTIENNIALSEEKIDRKRMAFATKVACIDEFIEQLPLGYNTKIGEQGLPISLGQKQRILIARAVYKNPHYMFLDEATSALDAKNESQIMQNLNMFYKGKTVFVIAHRLSTVVNADTIVVLDRGKIIEQGTHSELVSQKGYYYNLVKNQIELGD